MPSSEALTRGVRVVVNARYSSSHSDPAKREWFLLYTVTITNEGEDTVQLVNRHWVIMNANGHVEEVRGPGVVGNQPTLKTGESFEYTSGCPLKTPFGSMHGEYEMVTADGDMFLAEIAQGKSNMAIAESLVLSKRAVEKHINSIFLKLGLGFVDDVSKRVKATLMFLSESELPSPAGAARH